MVAIPPRWAQVTVRFPHFSGSAFYDPSLAYRGTPPTSSAAALRASSSVLALIAGLAVSMARE